MVRLIKHSLLVSTIMFVILLPTNLWAQCPIGAVVLNSQADVDDFIVSYPNCTELHVPLRIEGVDIVNLNGLSNLTYLNGLLMLNNAQLSSLIGLHHVQVIAGGCSMLDNGSLTSFDGLNSLEYIGSQFQIEANSHLENFSGLELLDSITGQLFIYNNPRLSDISALEHLSFIGTNLIVTICPKLSDCSITSICNHIDNATTGFLFFSDNAGGCNSQEEVELNCRECLMQNIWQGPAGGSWHTDAHWSLSTVPTDCHHVIIPPDSEVKVLAGQEARAFTLSIDPNAVFVTETSAQVNVFNSN